MVNIEKISLKDKPLFLAPMEDVTDPSFRHICKKFGADVVYTEFVASEALIRDIKKTIKKMHISDYERPAGIQIYGHILESMVEAARIVEQYDPDIIDINFGCPVKKIATRGAGAGLLKNVPLMVEMTKEIVNTVNKPVTVKTRLGWDEQSIHIVETAEKLQDVGISALVIHGRTRSQFYKGKADWTKIGEVKNNPRMKIPIIGNGDIIDAYTAKEAFDKFGVDGIMIGRAAIGRPWIFKQIRQYLDKGIVLPEPTVKEKVALAKEHLVQSMKWKEGNRGLYEMRRHFNNYFKGLPHFKELRLSLLTSLCPDEIAAILDEIEKRYGGVDDSG